MVTFKDEKLRLVKYGILIVMYFLMVGCANSRFDVGLAVHPNQFDRPEYDGSNPLGFIRIKSSIQKDQYIFCEHISSVLDYERGYGLNMCGVGVRVY